MMQMYSSRYVQLSELHHYLQWTLTISLHEDKVSNFIKIVAYLDNFTVMSSSSESVQIHSHQDMFNNTIRHFVLVEGDC